jgi:hypothetical protein
MYFDLGSKIVRIIIIVLIFKVSFIMDISDEIVFPIYDEMHLNHGKLEIKCTGN